MVYIVTILVLLYFIGVFDIGNKGGRRKWRAYKIMLIWFVFLSGFQYCIGADMIEYMREYAQGVDVRMEQTEVFGFYKRQYGWLFLESMLKSVTNDFFFLKLIQATFINVVLFRFFKKHAEYPFIAILLYFIIQYFDLNFNILRQSFAIGFFLLGYDYICEKHNKGLLKYLFFAFMAFLFHNSAVLLILVPIIVIISRRNVALKSDFLFLLVFLVMTVFLSFTSFSDTLLQLSFLLEGADNTVGVSNSIDSFLSNDRMSKGNETMRIFIYLMYTTVAAFIFLINKDKKYFIVRSDLSVYKLCYALEIVGLFLPIIGRFNAYFVPFYIVALTTVIRGLRENNSNKALVTYMVIIIVSILPIREKFSVNHETGVSHIYDYYPYHTIITKETSDIRTRAYGRPE